MADGLHLRHPRLPRRDFNAAAREFALKQNFISGQRTLDATLAVKALDVASSQPNGNRKKTSGGQGQREPKVRFDKSATKKPGQYFKNWTSLSEMYSSGDKPNYGWVDPVEPMSPAELQQAKERAIQRRHSGPKLKIVRYDMDPRTGGFANPSEYDNEEKSLGRKLSELLPGRSAGARAAGAAGLIVDDLGKFRCPPGTPAANQFTDAFGTNCFEPIGFLREAIGDLGRMFRRDFQYVNPVDPDKRGQIAALAENVAGTKDDVARAKEAADSAIDALKQKVGTTSSSAMNADLFDVLNQLTQSGEIDLEWKGILTDIWGDGSNFSWDDSLSADENMARFKEVLIESLFDAMSPTKSGRDAFAQSYYSGDEFANDLIDDLVQKHTDVMRGALTAYLQAHHENPDFAKSIQRIKTYTPRSDDDTVSTYGFTQAESDGKVAVSVNFQAFVLRPYATDADGSLAPLSRDGKLTLVNFDGPQTEAEKLNSLRTWLQEQGRIDSIALDFMQAYGMDMTEAVHASISARGQQVMWHEMVHAVQYQGGKKQVIDVLDSGGQIYLPQSDGTVRILSGPSSAITNADMALAMEEVIVRPHLYGQKIPPYGVTDLEGSMVHLLGGKYYQDMVEQFFDGQYLLGDRDSHAGVMVLEAVAEMYALEKMGILKGDAVRDAVSWIDDVGSPSTWTPTPPGPATRPGQPVTPGSAPDVDPPDVDADAAADGIMPHLVETVVDRSTGEILPAKGSYERSADMFELMRRKNDPRAWAQQQRSHVNAEFMFEDVSYDYLDTDELDYRYETLRDEVARLSAKFETDGLDRDEQTRLFWGIRGMEQILNQNSRRWRMSPAAQARARSEGKKYLPGKYSRKSITDPTSTDISDISNLLPDLMDKLGQSNLKKSDLAPKPITPGPLLGDIEATATTLGKLTPAVRSALQDPDLVRRGSMLRKSQRMDDAIKSVIARRAQGDTSAQSPADEFNKVILPVMKAMDEIPLPKESTINVALPDGAGDVSVGDSIDHSNMIVGKLASPSSDDISSGLPNETGMAMRIVMPKGSKGLPRRSTSGDSNDSIIIPSGTLKVIEIQDDGTIIATPTRQDGLKETSQRIIGQVKNLPSTRNPTELRERNNLRRAAERGLNSSTPTRGGFASRQSTRSADITTAADVETRNRLALQRAKDMGFTPFNLSDEQLGAMREAAAADKANGLDQSDAILWSEGLPVFGLRPKTQSEARESARRKWDSSVSSFFDEATSGSFSFGGGNLSFEVNPAVKKLLDSSSKDDVAALLNDAIKEFSDGFDRRIRVAIPSERLDGLLESGRYLTTHEAKSDHSGPDVRRRVEFTWGYPPDTPADMRPASGFVTHREYERARKAILDTALEENLISGLPFANRDPELLSQEFGMPEGQAHMIYGRNQIVLKQDVSRRSALVYGDSVRDGGRPVSFTSENVDDMLAAYTAGMGQDDMNFFIHGLLEGAVTGDMHSAVSINSRKKAAVNGKNSPEEALKLAGKQTTGYHEALVHSSFDLDDIEHIKLEIHDVAKRMPNQVSPTDVGAENESVTSTLRDAGLSDEEISKVFSMLASDEMNSVKAIVNTSELLRLAKIAQIEKDKFSKYGVDVSFRNEYAIDLLDPDNYLNLPHPYDITPGDAVSVLQQFVASQIIARKDKIVTAIKPRPTVSRDPNESVS